MLEIDPLTPQAEPQTSIAPAPSRHRWSPTGLIVGLLVGAVVGVAVTSGALRAAPALGIAPVSAVASTAPASWGSGTATADDQPGAADTRTGSTVPGASPAPGAVARTEETSSNWSGYVAQGGTFTSVTGTWTVPDPSNGSRGADATWVGIGGVTGHDLIQAGTQSAVTGNGSTELQAWIEMLPRPSQSVPLTVSPGDSVTVTITDQGADSWLISLTNNTTTKAYSTTARYASTRSSAEWIVEAPSAGRGILPVDNFGTVAFAKSTAVRDGKTVTLGAAGARPVTMINGLRQALAQPSSLGPDGASFRVSRTSVPAGQPAPTRHRG